MDSESNSKRCNWWRGSVLYHIYLRSFSDSNRDGFGDLKGATEHLDYVSELGISGIWLSPTMPSPNYDWGYDVSDYLGVHPDYGTLEDLDHFVSEAESRGMKVLLDLVPNHTSSEHPWFVSALSDPNSPYRNYYVFAKPKGDGSPPNNWLDATGESAWTLDDNSGEYYLHNFLSSQPDLNWWNDSVHEEFERILHFWFDRGIAGFRIDVAHALYKDRELQDDPPAGNVPAAFSHFGLLEKHSKNQDDVHDVYRRWRKIASDYDPERLLVGETWVDDMSQLASFYGSDDELNLAFNFPFMFAEFSSIALSRAVSQTFASLPVGSTPVWTASNHDVSRFPTRWAGGSQAKVRMALSILTTLPGTIVLYYGDELGLCDVEVALEDQRDSMTSMVPKARFQRDRVRTPMQWKSGIGRGFAEKDVKPWLPFGLDDGRDVESQRRDQGSIFNLTKSLLELRTNAVKADAEYREIEVTDDSWHYKAGKLSVFVNFSDKIRVVELGGVGTILTANGDSLLLEGSDKEVTVGPWEAVVRSS